MSVSMVTVSGDPAHWALTAALPSLGADQPTQICNVTIQHIAATIIHPAYTQQQYFDNVSRKPRRKIYLIVSSIEKMNKIRC